VKRVLPQMNDKSSKVSTSNLPLTEDNTLSIDDLPLVERTSPNKPILNIQEILLPQQIISTPTKKKSLTNKTKTNTKRTNNTLGVAVIEERRVRIKSL
jgi:hypothetical protein